MVAPTGVLPSAAEPGQVKATLPGGRISLVARDPSAVTEAVADTSASKGMPVDKALAHREVEAAIEELAGLRRDPRLLWVDDHPNDKRHEIAAFEALGLTSIVTRGRGARPVHTAGSE